MEKRWKWLEKLPNFDLFLDVYSKRFLCACNTPLKHTEHPNTYFFSYSYRTLNWTLTWCLQSRAWSTQETQCSRGSRSFLCWNPRVSYWWGWRRLQPSANWF